MALTYSQMKIAMQEALEMFVQASKRKAQGLQMLNQSKVDTDSIMVRFGPAIDDLAARAAAEPENVAIQGLNAEVQQMLADYAEFKTATDALVAAIPAE